MKVALISPWNPKETAIAHGQLQFFKAFSSFGKIDYFSTQDTEVQGIKIHKITLSKICEYDVLHFHWGNNSIHLFEYFLLVKLRLIGLKNAVVSSIHDGNLHHLFYTSPYRNSLYRLLRWKYPFVNNKIRKFLDIVVGREITALSDGLIFHSKHSMDVLQEKSKVHINKSKVFYTRLGADRNKFEIKASQNELRKKYDIPTDSIVFLYSGSIAEIKGVDAIVKALARQKNRNFYFAIIGQGPEAHDIVDLANKLILGKCKFFGYTTELGEFNKLADVIVNPRKRSQGEVSAVFPDAYISARPVIAPNIGSISEYLDDSLGYLCKSHDVDEYAKAISFFLQNPEEIKKRGNKAREFALEKICWDAQIPNYIAIYKQLMKAKGYSKIRYYVFANLENSFNKYLQSEPIEDYETIDKKDVERLANQINMKTREDSPLISGWYNLEKDGNDFFRWTNGTGAFYAKPIEGLLKIILSIPPYIKEFKIQHEEEILFGSEIKYGRQEICIPIDNTESKPILIKSNQWVPAEVVENSDDKKKLGVQVFEINITPGM